MKDIYLDTSSGKKASVLEKALASGVKDLTEGLLNITDYRNYNELMAISMALTCPILSEMLEHRVKEAKYVKRKHSAEILTGLKYLSGNVKEQSKLKQLLSFNRGNRI